MSKPIAQTFYINEPVGGAEGVILTGVDIYFASVSSTYGIEVQIRQTENGNPTKSMLPRASKILNVDDTYSSDYTYDLNGTSKTIASGTKIITASSDASVPTRFTFDTPISLQSQTAYAIVIIPIGGNPDYKVWTSELGANDITSSTPVYTNNDTGTLFLSSNDIQFTSVLTEDIKFTLYIANFTASSGTAVYNLFDEERIYYVDLAGSFFPNETVVVSNAQFNLASLSINSNTGAFTAGEVLYQSNGSANNATGVLYSANSSKILIANSVGTWVVSPGSNTYQVVGVTSSSYANTSAVSQNVITYGNTTVIVPFTGNSTANIFYANQSIYLMTNNRSNTYATIVESVINSTAIQVNSSISFSDGSSQIGQIRGDRLALYGQYSGPQAGDADTRFGAPLYVGWLYNVTSSPTLNFSNTFGQYFIGLKSQSSSVSLGLKDMLYNAVIPDFTQVSSKNTTIDWTFKGTDYANNYDASAISVVNGTEKELVDKTRRLISRSNEILNFGSNNTLTFTASMTTANSKFSPFIDSSINNIRFLRNQCVSEDLSKGYYVSISNTNGHFTSGLYNGDIISQNNGSTTVTGRLMSNSPSGLYIANTTGPFVAGYSVVNASNNSINAYASSVTEYNEKFSSNVFSFVSRYISKSVVLAENQDAEDLKMYLTAYRPAGTNFQIYGKFLHAQDQDSLSSKIWSRLSENTTSQALLSSGANPDDFVELVYDLPTSVLVLANAVTTSLTSPNVSMSSTSAFSNGDFVYLYNSYSGSYIVRQIVNIANNTTLTLNSNCSFTSPNTGVYADIGVIPGLEHQTGAFLNANNNGIVRYVSSGDVVYDTYKTFAVKIVPIADDPALVPRAGDYRALALQV